MSIEENLLHTLMVGGIAHAIRLGKRPQPGMVMSCNVQLMEVDDGGAAEPKSRKLPLEFTVTAELLTEADQMVGNVAQYREPKTTVVSLAGDDIIPEQLWKFGKKVQGK